MLRMLIVIKVEWVLIESVYLGREVCSYVSIVSAAIIPDSVYRDEPSSDGDCAAV